MPIVPFLPALASVATAGLGVLGASQAAGAQNRASDQSAALFEKMFGRADSALTPWVNNGQTSQSALMSMLGLNGSDAGSKAFNSWLGSTDYQFTRDQGLDGIQQSAANRGLMDSGGKYKALSAFNQDHARTYIDKYEGMLGGLSQQGLGAGSALAGSAYNFAGLGAQNNNNRADATGNAWLTGTSALSSGLGALGQLWPGGGGALGGIGRGGSLMGSFGSSYGG